MPNEPAGKHRVYAHLLDPREHPDYARRHVRPPTWDTFEGRTHFATLRNFEIDGGRLVRYVVSQLRSDMDLEQQLRFAITMAASRLPHAETSQSANKTAGTAPARVGA